MLEKSGDGKVSFGYYQEILFRKLERGDDASIRAMSYDGLKVGKVKSVGFEKIVLLEEDGDMTSIKIDDILDIQ
jgi:hypothetical protein